MQRCKVCMFVLFSLNVRSSMGMGVALGKEANGLCVLCKDDITSTKEQRYQVRWVSHCFLLLLLWFLCFAVCFVSRS